MRKCYNQRCACSVECYLHYSVETVHYKSDKTANFCGFICATTSSMIVFFYKCRLLHLFVLVTLLVMLTNSDLLAGVRW